MARSILDDETTCSQVRFLTVVQLETWQGRKDSNPRPSVLEFPTRALPASARVDRALKPSTDVDRSRPRWLYRWRYMKGCRLSPGLEGPGRSGPGLYTRDQNGPDPGGLAVTHWPMRLPSTVFGSGRRGKRPASLSSALSHTMLFC